MQKKKVNNSNGIVLSNLFHHEFLIKDVLQVVIGAGVLAIPVGFTEETWRLGEYLPLLNVFFFVLLSLTFISFFVYYNYHHKLKMKGHMDEFAKRVVFTYFFSFLVVAVLLTLIQKAPWQTDILLAFKRTALVTFPASMSAAVADTLK